MLPPQGSIEHRLATAARQEARNRSAARFWAFVLAVALIIIAFSSTAPPSIPYIAVVYGLAFLASRSHAPRFRFAGWAFVALIFLLIYTPALHPASMSFTGIAAGFRGIAPNNADVITKNVAHFKDAYTITASASFTLYGFFFLALKRVERIQLGVRLFTIAQVFGAVLALSVTALLPITGWWRYGFLLLEALTTLVALAREPQPYIIDSTVDRPGAATFWDRWLRNRTGQAIVAFVGLFVMPLWPEIGEVFFVLGLLYLVSIAASTSTYLYLSNELANTRQTDEQLRLLYRFPVSRDFEDLPYKRHYGVGVASNRLASIPFQFYRPAPTEQEKNASDDCGT